MKRIALIGLLAACAGSESPPKNEFEAFERKFVAEGRILAEAMLRAGKAVKASDLPTSYRAVFIGPSGVFVDRKLVATLAELDTKRPELVKLIAENAALTGTKLTMPMAMLELYDQPAATAIAALRLFAGRETHFYVPANDPELPMKATSILCSATIHDQPGPASEDVRLSVLLDPGEIWVGLSRINEFQEIPDATYGRDIEKLDVTLREHKHTAFFEDRTDLELGGTAGTSGDVLAAVGVACKQGFIDLVVLPRDQLSAVPTL